MRSDNNIHTGYSHPTAAARRVPVHVSLFHHARLAPRSEPQPRLNVRRRNLPRPQRLCHPRRHLEEGRHRRDVPPCRLEHDRRHQRRLGRLPRAGRRTCRPYPIRHHRREREFARRDDWVGSTCPRVRPHTGAPKAASALIDASAFVTAEPEHMALLMPLLKHHADDGLRVLSAYSAAW